MHNLYYYTKFKSKWEEKLVNVGEIYCYSKIRLWGRQSANKGNMNILSPYLYVFDSFNTFFKLCIDVYLFTYLIITVQNG